MRRLKAQYANPGGWAQILAYMAFCEVLPGTDPRKRCVCWRLWIQGVDCFWPGWENQKNLMPKSLTEDLRWWPSSACFSRRGWGSVRILFVTTLQEKKHHKESGWKSATMQSISTTESTSVKKETQLCVNSYGVFWVSEVYFSPATFSEHCMFGLCNIVLTAIFTHMFASKVSL